MVWHGHQNRQQQSCGLHSQQQHCFSCFSGLNFFCLGAGFQQQNVKKQPQKHAKKEWQQLSHPCQANTAGPGKQHFMKQPRGSPDSVMGGFSTSMYSFPNLSLLFVIF
mmetsp:Transcript_25739/g.64852  ORF Transcript_25739/g.64852 Transcript_25739/m.64852 type:complete len:108 (-) Transcript_25739:181-504(-)